tara:strand:- start:16571 stop:16720 length:150 start_codon:yes stop_codon:yes gene_type:complete
MSGPQRVFNELADYAEELEARVKALESENRILKKQLLTTKLQGEFHVGS